MHAQLDARLSEFFNDLQRAERLLELIIHFRIFAASATVHSPEEPSAWNEALDLGRTAQTVRPDLPILAGSLHLYICGLFEYFVRDLVVIIADSLSASVGAYSELPEGLRKELHDLTIMICQNPTRFGYKAEQAETLLISLATNLQGGANPVSVQAEVLATTESNMHPGLLADIMKRVGIQSIWKEIGKQAPLKTFLDARSDGECIQEAHSRLASIMRDRNGFAHPTSSTEFPDVHQVRTTCDFLKVLAEVLVDVAKLPQ